MKEIGEMSRAELRDIEDLLALRTGRKMTLREAGEIAASLIFDDKAVEVLAIEAEICLNPETRDNDVWVVVTTFEGIAGVWSSDFSDRDRAMENAMVRLYRDGY